jgi:hypothetical protein
MKGDGGEIAPADNAAVTVTVSLEEQADSAPAALLSVTWT